MNFDRTKTVNPVTGKSVDHWYKVGETFTSVFDSLGQPYEECRAEGIAHYLAFEPKALKIFGYTDPKEAGNLLYTAFFELILSGIESLKTYEPSNPNPWNQAHSQGNYVLLRVLLQSECGELIKMKVVQKSEKDGKSWRF